MNEQSPQLQLLRYTFYSLQFSATPVATWRGQQFATAVNQWFMPFIQSGWPVPLSLSIDLAAMLLNPRETPQGFTGEAAAAPELLDLARRYRETLTGFRKAEEFQFVTELVQTTPDPARQTQVIRSFLEMMFAPIAGMKHAYSFNTRSFQVQQAAINSRGAQLVVRTGAGESLQKGKVGFGAVRKIAHTPEGRAVQNVLDVWCDFFEKHPLSEVLTPDLRLVLELTATTPFGKGRVDYALLNWLLHRPDLEDVEELEPAPTMVDEEIPTNPYPIEGQVGGYIDVQRKRFSGNLGEVLPMELGLWEVKTLMLQKLLNEGMLTYVRENVEHIDKELRLLFCFVVDNDPRMLLPRPDHHPDLPGGLTPYIRARALAARMLQDLCRFLPRQEVFVDCGLFLWSPGGISKRNHIVCPAEVDLFWMERTSAADQYRFLRHLMQADPELFYSKLGEAEHQVRPHLEPDPDEFMRNKQHKRRFHCRHVVLLTSAETEVPLVESLDLDLYLGMAGPDSLFLVHCDVTENTYGVECADDVGPAMNPAQIGESALRQSFLEAVMHKAAGKPLTSSLMEKTEVML
jgi:hypothetical protein